MLLQPDLHEENAGCIASQADGVTICLIGSWYVNVQGKHSMFEGISDPDHLEAGHRFAVLLLNIPHVQLHLEVLEFRRTFAESVSRVSTGLRSKLMACYMSL